MLYCSCRSPIVKESTYRERLYLATDSRSKTISFVKVQHKSSLQTSGTNDIFRIMKRTGLGASVWAKKSPNGRPDPTPQPGDWQCTECTFSNFSWRSSCFHCSTPKGGFKITKANKSAQEAVDKNDASLHANIEPRGLAKSCFAPRNYKGGNKTREIWTYVCLVVRSDPFRNIRYPRIKAMHN